MMFLAMACFIFLISNFYFYFLYKKAEQNFRLTLEASSDIVFLIDKNAKYLDVFASQDNILLESRDKLIGSAIEDILGPKLGRESKAVIEKAFLTGKRQFWSYEVMLDSKLSHFEASVVRRDSNVVVATIRDVSERKTLQQQLEIERVKQFESARLASLGEVAGGIAHEMNTPLAIILASAQFLENDLKKDPLPAEKMSQQVQKILLTTHRIASIVKGLRALARDGSSDAFNIASVENIVQNTLELCADKFQQKGIDIQVDLEKDLKINCRAVQISQILLNLLNNAFHAITQNKNSESAFVLIAARHIDEKNIEISVTDSGIGIPSEIQHRLFEPFFTTKSADKGTGLGLSISSSLMADHHGELVLDTLSKQTRFCMRFKIV